MRLLTSSCLFLAASLATLVPHSCQGFSYNFATLTPKTPPAEVVTANLLAFQNHDLQTAFDLASPAAKADIDNDVDVYRLIMAKEQGWRCYGYLMEHQEAEILLETSPSTQCDKHRVLVRVVPSDHDDTSSQAVKEYWWTLSRCPESECFMVDAIDPAGTLPLDWSDYFF